MMSEQERIELNKTLPKRMLVRDGGSQKLGRKHCITHSSRED
jgi:hypothetical protein